MERYLNHNFSYTKLFVKAGLLFLLSAFLFGILAALQYIFPGIGRNVFSFDKLRPLHVSSAVFWILMAAMGAVLSYLQELKGFSNDTKKLIKVQFFLFCLSFSSILVSYCFGVFGGREYWEFHPLFSIPILIGWCLFLVNFFSNVKSMKGQPVYIWMWITGVIFFLFTYIESNLWLIPSVRNSLVKDMTLQWKSYGSMVGAWNMLIYGSAIYLMDKISGHQKYSHSNMAFALYGLSLFNLMFNWGHHIYTLPTANFAHIIAYAVSMTELLILGRIIYTWRTSLSFEQKHKNIQSYWFLYAADMWVFINLGLAIAMSVPALNIYMHGTHIIVAHTMGTTIGINTMLLLAVAYDLVGNKTKITKSFKPAYWLTNCSLGIFFIALIIAGIIKSYWQFQESKTAYAAMFAQLRPWFYVFFLAGCILVVGFLILIIPLLKIRKKRAVNITMKLPIKEMDEKI